MTEKYGPPPERPDRPHYIPDLQSLRDPPFIPCPSGVSERVHDLVVSMRLTEQAMSMLREELDDLRAAWQRDHDTLSKILEAAAIRTALEVASKEAQSSQVITRGQTLSAAGQVAAAVIGAVGAILVWALTQAWEMWRH